MTRIARAFPITTGMVPVMARPFTGPGGRNSAALAQLT
jgi:hypothetical protein